MSTAIDPPKPRSSEILKQSAAKTARWLSAAGMALVCLACGVAGMGLARADDPAAAEEALAPPQPAAPGEAAGSTDPQPDQHKVNFSTQVQPIFINHCYKCHGAEKRSGGLRLDRYTEAQTGGDSGRPILGGTLETNELYQRVASSERAYRMPKNADALPQDEIETIKRWVEQGSDWPVYARGEAKSRREPETWILRAASWLDQYQAEVDYAKPFAALFVFGQLVILVIARCRAAYQNQRPWAIGRARRWCEFCNRVSKRELLLMWSVMALCVPLVILRGHERRLTAEVTQLRIVKTSRDSSWSKTVYGFPPKPIRPDHPKQLAGTYYRGNCERNPALFNNGNYLTALFHISLCGSDHKPLQVGDAVPPSGLFVHVEIERAVNTTELLFTKDLMESVCLSEKFNDVDPPNKIPDPVRLYVVEDGLRWAADYPLGQPSGANDLLRGVIYVYMGWHGGERFTGDPHYGIVYDVGIDNGKVGPDAEIWMNSFGNPAFEDPPLPGKMPFREWFDHRPIPSIAGENTKDPKLLGVEEYVKKGLIPPPQASDPDRPVAADKPAEDAQAPADGVPADSAPQAGTPNQEAK